MEVVEETNGLRASLNFRAAGWFGKDLHRFDGFIYSKTYAINNSLDFLNVVLF
jgi:hypothetical protein